MFVCFLHWRVNTATHKKVNMRKNKNKQEQNKMAQGFIRITIPVYQWMMIDRRLTYGAFIVMK